MRLTLGAALSGAILLFLSAALSAQSAVDANAPVAEPVTAGTAERPAKANEAGATTTPPDEHIDKRIFGVLPNYRTASGMAPFVPITAKRKFTIAAKDSFDYPVYFTAAAFAGFYQLDNENPSFGQGLKGYAKRFGSAYADQAVGNLMAEGLMPALLHEDPRYFRLGTESEKSGRYRFLYALRGVMVARTDHGNWAFNGGEWLGNASSVALSNLYYPSDTRDAEDNAEKLLIAVATDAFSNVLKEFWPDIKHKFFKNKR